MPSIKIGPPYIKYMESFVRLCSHIELPEGNFELYYEVPFDYEPYLCTERSNSFVLGILEFAMYKGYNIECEAPLDEALYYQLTNYGMDIITQNLYYMKKIEINAPYTSKVIESHNAVGTGFSAGVDSFYTVLKHLDTQLKSYNLTHLLIANIGAFTYAATEKTEKIFYKQVEVLSKAVSKLGDIPLLSVNTNYNDLYLMAQIPIELQPHISAGTSLKICGCVYALQKLFSKYYIASSFQLDKFQFDLVPDFALLYYLKLCSTPFLSFYGSGLEVKRIQKLQYIANNNIVQHYLSIDLGKNCSRCSKCLRTLLGLYAINKLDDFENVFDINGFKTHLSSRIAEYFADNGEKKDGFVQEFVQMCKTNHISIPFTAYLKCIFIYKPFTSVKNLLRKSKLIRKFYYKFNLDVKRNGEEARAWRSSYLPEMEWKNGDSKEQ